MEQFREIISYLKIFQPKILSTGSEHTLLKKISLFHQGQDLNEHTIYVGSASELSYILRFHENLTFFIIADSEITLPNDCHGNFCVLFPKDTDIEDLVSECQSYLKIQTELYEFSHLLMEAYISDGTLQTVVTCAEQIINNPIMIIDNNYQVICEAGSDSCGDIVWCENIKNGYCSYEFITQFNQISEVRHVHTYTSAFMSGCLNSPLRRCICKLQADNTIIGYLLAIETNSPFDELKMQFLELTGRLVSRMFLQSNQAIPQIPSIQITNLFTDMLTGKLKSSDVLQNFLKNSNIKLKSSYYLISVNIENYKFQEKNSNNALEQALAQKIDYVLTTCIKTNIIYLTESSRSLNDITEALQNYLDFFAENNLSVAISDHFESLEDLSVYYSQTNFVHRSVRTLKLEGKTVCTYDNLRIMDILTRIPTLDNYLYLIGNEYTAIRRYDEKHHTEYLKTLYYYIRWNHNLQKVASILCVHKNTVSYRIQRAKELFNLDLKDFHVTMHIYTGYLIYLLKDNDLLKHENID